MIGRNQKSKSIKKEMSSNDYRVNQLYITNPTQRVHLIVKNIWAVHVTIIFVKSCVNHILFDHSLKLWSDKG